MRFLNQNPGATARKAAYACRLPSSNFSRVLKGLVAKGLLERKSDDRDARIIHLYPTSLARKNAMRMREAWSEVLRGAALDQETLSVVTRALGRIEAHLAFGSSKKGDAASSVSGQLSRPDDNQSRRTTDAE